DSVMPQTIEAISHAKAAGVPMIVAINKIDKPDANPDRIKQQLADHGVLIEEWGGKYQHVEISAKKGINIDELLEKILLEADILDLKANPNRKAKGVVIESNVSKGLGPVATIIVQKGTLKIGDPFVSGIHHGRVRAMQDERGNKMDVATPAVPVRVMGFDGLPEAGDNFFVVDSEAEARSISNERKQLKREQEMRRVRHLSLDEISSRIKLGSVQELNLIIKGDVGGSVEAISDSLLKLSTDEVRVNILHQGVGEISESDVMLAAASQAIIIGFNVSPSSAARRLADNEKIDIRLYNIIYDCINEVQMALEGLLKPEIKEEVTAEVEVRRIFKISRIGTIAGCYVLSGKISRNDRVKVLRNGLPIFNGTIASLKRNKDDVKEVDTSYECGIQLDGFNDIQEGDIIQGYKLVEIRRNL
ncbi:MAG TPA: translation initiation factor IF-2, partial [Candidatus Kapabacteria bacterium]|nr:translation initiation factor IF-2 [Candidatus Kapabacteria bacterium]